MWNDRLDARLLKLKRDGYSFAEIGERIGVSRNAAIGRFQRLNGRVFPSQVARRKSREEAARRKEEAHVRKQKELVKKMKAAIAAGMDRAKAMDQAYHAGASYKSIGEALGMSRQRANQIATGK